MDKLPNADSDQGAVGNSASVVVRQRKWNIQLIWLVPVMAVLIAGWLAAKAVMQRGPTITISFATADGIEAGKTKIKFKNVDVGTIQGLALSDDHQSVLASAEMSGRAASMLVSDTRFWVVRPRITAGAVSGISTLISGSHIGMDIGTSTEARRNFVGLESPPVLASGTPGREFVLKSNNIGSLDVGSPIFYRRLQVGQVVSYSLDLDGQNMTIRVFINAPYDRYVTNNSRFWHASGVDVTLDSSGVKIDTESVISVLTGGLAFENPPNTQTRTEADAKHEFRLFANRAEAMKVHDAIVDKYTLTFKESVRGLAVGAPVDFRGIPIGEVSAISAHFDPATKDFTIPVEVSIFPERLISKDNWQRNTGSDSSQHLQFASYLVSKGLRAQLRTGSLLTGQLYVAMDFFPSAPKVTMDWRSDKPQLPTVPGNLQSLQDALAGLVSKLNAIPFDGISKDLRKTLGDADVLLNTMNHDVAPDTKATLAAARETLASANRALQSDSPLQQSATDTMRELSRAAESVRSLADYLERHPESLIRGKSGDRP